MGCPISTQTGSVKMIERIGKFHKIATPGIDCLILPCLCIDNVAGTVSMRVMQIDVNCETKNVVNYFKQSQSSMKS